ncbi:BatA domain-containing protein [Mucilaginibacter litoreus]|uniref:BatA domain-containing protein n=1 Tax=Mucilaginibacter litoreus TaxID=1048221 RepID=A0ABW3ARZ8_9SPHI
MHFVYPAFLFALVSLAIPVIIHLFNFRRYKKVYFSNVQFLKEVEEQQAGRRNLKDRLVLLARLLTLLFLILAFAKPLISSNDAASAGKQHIISIFVDNSYSMQSLNREGPLLDQAKQRARQIAAAYNVNDRFQLLTQDFEGKHQRLLNRDEFNSAVDEIKISAQSRHIDQIVSRQQSLLGERADAVKQSYIISDFQKNIGVKTPLDVVTGTVNLVRLAANKAPNVTVDSAWLVNAVHRPGQTEKLVVKLVNYADKPADKVPLKLTINGVQKAVAGFSIGAHSSQTDTLTFSGLQAGWQRGMIELQDNPVVFDNQFYFSFKTAGQLPVLLINGGEPNKYLGAVFATDGFFKTTQVPYGNVNYTGLGSYPLVVLSDVKSISAGLAQQLRDYAGKGGTLIIFPADNADLSSYQSLLQPMGAASPQKRITEATKVSSLNMQSKVFSDIFEAQPQNPDLPIVKKYYQLSSASNGEYLMKLQNGQPFLSSFKYKKGKVYTSAVALSEDYSNLVAHALFVPIMLKVALLSGQEQPVFYTIGKNTAIETVPLQATEKELVKLVRNNEVIIPEVRQQDGSTELYFPDQLIGPGLYNLKQQDSTAAVLAFNDDKSESDLTYLSSAELDKMVGKHSRQLNGEKLTASAIGTAANSGIQLWKLCIILALVFLAAEILLIRYFKIADRSVLKPIDVS